MWSILKSRNAAAESRGGDVLPLKMLLFMGEQWDAWCCILVLRTDLRTPAACS